MYIVVIAILSLILTFPAPPFPWLAKQVPVLSVVAAATLLPAMVALIGGKRSIQQHERRPDDPSLGHETYSRTLTVAQFVLAIAHGAVIGCTNWLGLSKSLPGVDYVPGLPGMIAAVPFLISILLVWTALYPAERAGRQIALEYDLFANKPPQPVWGLGEYLVFQFRHQILFILLPMILVLMARDVIEWYRTPLLARFHNDNVPDLLLGAAAIVVAVFTPGILRHVWDTKPLPPGPLREQLEMLCKKLNLRCREILVWRTGGMIVNAMVMGVVPWLRYVMITDGLLQRMDETKIEAVFGHESGHVKRRHILFFLLFAFTSGCLMTIIAEHSRTDRRMFAFVVIAAGVFMLLKWGLVFGWISRMFERQADLFGVRTLALSGLPCSSRCDLHTATPERAAPIATLDGRRLGDEPLCPTAAHIFADMLHDVARLNGIPPEAPCWRHGSISKRARTVEAYALDPEATRKFERQMRMLQLAITIVAVGAMLWAAWEIRVWTVLGIGK